MDSECCDESKEGRGGTGSCREKFRFRLTKNRWCCCAGWTASLAIRRGRMRGMYVDVVVAVRGKVGDQWRGSGYVPFSSTMTTSCGAGSPGYAFCYLNLFT